MLQSPQPRYPLLVLTATAEEADEISALVVELGATGIEERDDHTLERGPGAGKVTLVASFPTLVAAEEARAELAVERPDLGARVEELVGDAWRDAWKEHFAPFALTPRITVVPPWLSPKYERLRESEQVLELEPGRAFGTGLHATTALVAELLDARAAALTGQEVLDVGTGSGILALVALLLGAARAVAIDVDADVIDVVRENAARNRLGDRIEARSGVVESVTRAFPWVLANIEARVLRPLAPELSRVVAPGGALVLSGILAPEHDELVAIYAAHRLHHLETRRRDEWVAVLFSR